MTTALLWSSRFLWHSPGPGSHVFPAAELMQPGENADNGERVHRIYALADAIGLTERLQVVRPDRMATREELERFHTPAYLDRVQALSAAAGGDTGDGAPITAGGYEIACLAAGACMQAVDLVVDGEVDNSYALVRPPGHHAERDRGVGSCIFGNAVLSIMHARAARGVGRVAVIDWDAHHGNSAQEAFWDDPEVLAISVHQDSAYPPNSGPAAETGGPSAPGTNINVPLPPGSGEGAYFDAFDRVIIPALHEFKPDLIVVAAGYDPGIMEQNSTMMLHTESFRRLARSVKTAAEELCDGRLVVIHEGGFNLAQLPLSALAVLETLADAPPTEDPYFAMVVGDTRWSELQPHQKEVIDEVIELHKAAS